VATATIVSDVISTPTTHLLARKQLDALANLLVRASLRAGITTRALLVGPNSDALTVARHPVAVPVPTTGTTVDPTLVPFALLLLIHTPPLGLIAPMTVANTERETMTIGVDARHHDHHLTPVEGFPTSIFDATIRTTKASASAIAGWREAGSVTNWLGNTPHSPFAMRLAWGPF